MKTLLLVEDDVDIQENLKLFLESENYRVLTAGNGIEALQSLNQHTEVALVLLDLMMPVMNGYEFLDKYLDQPDRLKPPVILLSAAADIKHIATERKLAFAKKPIDLDQLLALIAHNLAAPK